MTTATQNPEPARVRGRPFTGVGDPRNNPGGRPKQVRELLELARAAVPEALAFALKLLGDEKADDRVRLEAAKFLTAYGLGAPPKVVEDAEAPEATADKVTPAVALKALDTAPRGPDDAEN